MQLRLSTRTAGGVMVVDCSGKLVFGEESAALRDMVKKLIDELQAEGLILDPVYTGKAMAGLFDLLAKGKLKSTRNVIFLHTGGIPGLFAFPKVIEEPGRPI